MSRPCLLFPELAHPYEILALHSSPRGGEAPVHDLSVSASKDDAVSMSFLQNRSEVWKETQKLEHFVHRADDSDGIFYVGGWGLDSLTSHAVITSFYSARKLLSSVCHGTAAFAHVNAPGTERSILYGHKVTGVSQAEVDQLFPVVEIEEPWSVQGELEKAVGKDGGYEKADVAFGCKVLTSRGQDGRVFITGQNPASGEAVGKAIFEELFGRAYE